MAWTPDSLRELLDELRAHGKDFEDVEVKLGAGGVPDLGRTLSAFGNMPNGGTIIVGLDEKQGFAATGVADPGLIAQGIASTARSSVTPPVQVSFEEAVVDGATLVIATVAGLPAHQRPCRFQGQAWLRQSDGDYRMSEAEIQQVLAMRERPRWDATPVDGTTMADLDSALTAAYVTGVRATSRRLASEADEVVLKRKSIIAPDGGRLTVAGLYALGAYPQQFLPTLSITAAVQLDARSGQRTRDLVHLDGPLPDLLDNAVAWVQRNTLTTVRFGQDGRGRDETELPLVAVRELIANALVHRDLGPATRTYRVEMRLRADQLVITNPGGLYGVNLEQLGTDSGKSAVNEFLYDICKFVRTPSGDRVIEGEGGGIREVQRALRAANMRPPRFTDTGVRFTVLLPRHSLLGAADLEWLKEHDPATSLTSVQQQIITSMRRGQVWTNALVREEFAPIDSRDATSALQGLVAMELAESRGQRGQTEYVVAPGLAAIAQPKEPVVIVRPPASSRLPQQDPLPEAEVRESARATANGPAILSALAEGPATVGELQARTGLTRDQVIYGLSRLRKAGAVTVDGGQGKPGTTYHLAG